MMKIVVFLAFTVIISSKLLTAYEIHNISPFITGGLPANESQFPYQVALYMENEEKSDLCGATLIKHKWVLTAASCFYMGYTNYSLAFGSVDVFKIPAYVIYSINSSDFKIHPDYNNETNVNNIALIYVRDMPANLRNHKNIGAIALPTESEAKTNLTGMEVVISGYGLRETEVWPDHILHYMTTKITSNEVCRNIEGYNVTDSTLCIDTTGGKSPCDDQGSPMTIEIESKKILVGIVGPNSKHCTSGYPAIAESVLYHRQWIVVTSGSSVVVLSFSLFIVAIITFLRNLF